MIGWIRNLVQSIYMYGEIIMKYDMRRCKKEKGMLNGFIQLGYILSMLFFLTLMSIDVHAADNSFFQGNGTKENPYKIFDMDDLKKLREEVNKGEIFAGVYFQQQGDIDLKNEKWIPIANKESTVFYGNYDGNGYHLKNVKINSKEGFAAPFGRVGGTIANLGIESGNIKGETAAGIVGYMVGPQAAIYNCYNKATVKGNRVGGIADFCGEGTVAGCWNIGKLKSEDKNGIIAIGGDAKVYRCYATTKQLFSPRVVSKTSWSITKERLFSDTTVKKLNIATALMQYMYAEKSGIRLKEWKLSQNGELQYSNSRTYVKIAGFINYNLSTVLMMIGIFTFLIYLRKIDINKRIQIKRKYLGTMVLIAGILSVFLDTALVHYGFQYLKMGNAVFIILTNLVFLSLFVIWLKDKKEVLKRFSIKTFCKAHVVMIILSVVTIIFEIQQFDIVPKYDANLYYGSLLRAIETFRMDLITYIGSFVCWKWIHGLALLITPLEFIFPGQVVGVYISNAIITIITMWCLYWLFTETFSKATTHTAAIASGIFMFFPYSMGLFTYLCMDWHLTFFAVWLIYAVKKKNNLLICFCGYLLSFTKITGMVFYVIFLLIAGCYEIWKENDVNYVKKFVKWWSIKKVLLWTCPVILFMLTFLYGENITIQNFQGTYVSDEMFAIGNMNHLINTGLQTFVFGFRWLLIILFVITFIKVRFQKRNIDVVKCNEKYLIMAMIGAELFSLLLLCIYNSDADCPRYTAIFNVIYAFITMFIITELFHTQRMQKVLSMVLLFLFVIQTFWTIDPIIKKVGTAIETGTKKIYKLALPNDTRSGMNIGVHMQGGGETLGDIYAYNLELFFYDELLEEMLTDIQPEMSEAFYFLDVYEYEFYLAGNINKTYKIYWDNSKKKRTYFYDPSTCVLLQEFSVNSQDILNKNKEQLTFPEKFHMVVAGRVEESQVIKHLNKLGYKISNVKEYQNGNGLLRVYDVEE